MKINILKIIVLFYLGLIINGNHIILAEEIAPDLVAPVINLIGESALTLNVGDVYVDAGAIAQDETDGDITTSIITLNNVDISKSGTYFVTYDVKDKASNSAIQVVRTVIIKDVIVPKKLKEQVTIRNGDTIIYSGDYDLPEAGTIDIPDKNNVEHIINSRSVLALLYNLDQATNDFSFSNLDYNLSYDSLYLKCLTSGGVELCDNWQYVVNNDYPAIGMDKDILNGNEKIYLYFGPQNKVVLSQSVIHFNEELKVTAQKYDYQNNDWIIRSGVTVGVTKPDPSNPWTPNDDIKSLVDEVTGQATFLNVPVGSYDVGIKEDYYWPTEKLTVLTPVIVPSGGSSPIVISPIKDFSIKAASDFLRSKAKGDGSYGNLMYTDWVAIGLAATGDLSLKNYLKNHVVDSLVLTENERQAMALMATGINPYSGTSINYINKIVKSFDGQQFGDPNLVNDDIFALIVLKNAGFNSQDQIIQKDINYLIDQQKAGSWGSVDMTAAALQALRGLEDQAGVLQAMNQAENYLKGQQEIDFGFGNSSSTAWALQAFYQDRQILKAEGYLAQGQQADGGLEDITTDLNIRIWVTAYAVPAVLHKPWSQILNNFSKPEIVITPKIPVIVEPEVELKKDIIEPVVFSQDKKNDLKLNRVKEITKIGKTIVPKNKIIKTMHRVEGNSLLASIGQIAPVNQNNFLLRFSLLINSLKAPFIWLWHHLFV